MLVVSGGLARRGKSTLSWTVNNLYRSIATYEEDCMILGEEINKVRPSMEKMPFVSDELDEKPTDDKKTKVINIGKFYKNQEKFREILRYKPCIVTTSLTSSKALSSALLTYKYQ